MNGTTLLDGGVATELQRGGLAVQPPWWTTKALITEANRTLLRGIHQRYLEAGAEVLTAATFRCNLRALRNAGLDAAGLAWMVHAAVGVAQSARRATDRPDTLIAASVAPVEDAYRPDLVPPDDDLQTEHHWLATELSRAGIDLVLIETINTIREARIALSAARAAGLRAWVSFVCGDDARLLSGEPLSDAARVVEAEGAEAVMVNCTSIARTERCLEVLRTTCSGNIGAYPNLEHRTATTSDQDPTEPPPTAVTPTTFAETLSRWYTEYGARLLGGCCGSTPEHIAALHSTLNLATARVS
jgi:S-methylmethionine-dependent homocysteine/selenocysteine methylase